MWHVKQDWYKETEWGDKHNPTEWSSGRTTSIDSGMEGNEVREMMMKVVDIDLENEESEGKEEVTLEI